MFYQGHIRPDRVAFFSIPVPAILVDAEGSRVRLKISTAFSPDIQSLGLRRYLGTTLKWRLFRGDIRRADIVEAMSAPDDDDDDGAEGDTEHDNEHPVLPNELGSLEVGFNRRSRGTVQTDTFEWGPHQEEFSREPYTLALATYERWGRENPAPIQVAIVIRLDDLSRSIPIYQEVEQALTIEVEQEIEE